MKVFIMALVCSFLICSQLYSQNTPPTNNKLIAGFNFEGNLPESLKYYTITQKGVIDVGENGNVVTQKIVFNKTNGKDISVEVEVKITIAQEYTSDFYTNVGATLAPLRQSISESQIASDFGYNIGDNASFLGFDRTNTSSTYEVIFTRNNIALYMRKRDMKRIASNQIPRPDYSDEYKKIDLIAMVQGIDNYLKNQPTYDNLGQSGLLPQIMDFKLKDGVTEVKQQSITKLVVNAKDPTLKEEDRKEITGSGNKDDDKIRAGIAKGSVPTIRASGTTKIDGLTIFFEGFGSGGDVLRKATPSEMPNVSLVETKDLYYEATILPTPDGQRMIKAKLMMQAVNPKLLLMSSKSIDITVTE